jgi:TIR domain
VLAQLDVPENAEPIQIRGHNASQTPQMPSGADKVQATIPSSISSASSPVPATKQSHAAPPASPVLIYYSFAPADETLVRQFQNQMLPLKDWIIEWDRTKVIAGRITKIEVGRHLDEAAIILLFVSSDYLANKDCVYEMQRAMDRQGSVSIVPIILRPVAFIERTPIGQLRRYPENKTVADWGNRRATIFTEIAQEIGNIIASLPPA